VRTARAAAPPSPRGYASRYETPTAGDRSRGLWVEGAGYNPLRPSSDVIDHRRLGAYALVYVSRGSGWFWSEASGKAEVSAGTLLFLFPKVAHSYASHPSGWAEQWITFNGPIAEQYEADGFLDSARPLGVVGTERRLAALFDEIYARLTRPGPIAVAYASALAHELIVLGRGLRDGLLDTDDADPLIRRALAEMGHSLGSADSLGEECRPETIAARLGVPYSTLRRRFRARMGHSIKEHFMRERLRRAKSLLAFTEAPVHAIAAECGFPDPLYFSRLFRRREGVSPLGFRAQQAG
jgi:AraC-like DNA-binding protein